MKLHIRPEEAILTLQNRFSESYPNLRLEFISAGKILHSSTLIRKACQGKSKEGILEITPHTKVADLEQAFWKKFNMRVQVFRRTGNMWLETTATDNWTLEFQEKHGRESIELLKKDEMSDYDLSRGNNN